ncbi:MAG: arsenate reductase ArsC [Chloroflexota bacterium]|nr:arsenate reductase ArsC [Chloroflexota bacterium]MDE2839000.1 arsenate reductase ArsC [Chloroflexota bacterium]MDE2930213.1 arsenate reductase ArsC [Chloroflexota bacterium]
MNRILFVCVHNAGRSQMAEAFLRHLADGRAEAQSAGTVPGERVNPIAAQVMDERGISLAAHAPKLLTQELVDWADRVITMGCSIDESSPVVIAEVEDWGLPDPSGQPLALVRDIRDQIEARVSLLLGELAG